MNKHAIFTVALAALILLVFLFLRDDHPYFPGPASYAFLTEGAGLPALVNALPMQGWLLPLILFICCLLSVWLYVQLLPKTPFAWYVLVLSPLFFTSFFTLSNAFVILPLTFGAMLVLRRSPWGAMPLLVLLSLIDPVIGLCAFAAAFVLGGNRRVLTVGVVVSALGVWVCSLLGLLFMPALTFGGATLLYEYSLFIVLLGLLGLFLLWSVIPRGTGLAIIVALMLSSFYPGMRVVTNVLLATLAGLALQRLHRRSWAEPLIKGLTQFLVGASLLLSAAVSTQQLAEGPPTEALEAALRTLPRTDEFVLTDEATAPYVRYYAGREVYVPADEEADVIYHSRLLNTTLPLLRSHHVGHLVITEAMRDQYWTRPDDGLLFLLENSETFINRISSRTVNIWAVE